MLANHDVAVNIAVKDVAVARRFYGETLGLAEERQEEGLVAFKSGTTTLFVYRSEFAGTNKATVCTWMLGGEFDAVVAELKGKGVVFVHYDNMPGVKLEGDVHVAEDGSRRVVWFKDPDSNILCVATDSA